MCIGNVRVVYMICTCCEQAVYMMCTGHVGLQAVYMLCAGVSRIYLCYKLYYSECQLQLQGRIRNFEKGSPIEKNMGA